MRKPTTGDILTRLMQVKKINNIELSKKAGLSESAISEIRNDRCKPQIATLKILARALDVPANLLAKYIRKEEAR